MSSDVVYVREDAPLADILRAVIAKEDGKKVKLIRV